MKRSRFSTLGFLHMRTGPHRGDGDDWRGGQVPIDAVSLTTVGPRKSFFVRV
jgi:hypothetical protein